jgi:hypothetical protein
VNQFNPDRGTFKTWLLQYAYHRSIDRPQHLQANRFYSRDELDDLMPAELFSGPGHLLCLPPQEGGLQAPAPPDRRANSSSGMAMGLSLE